MGCEAESSSPISDHAMPRSGVANGVLSGATKHGVGMPMTDTIVQQLRTSRGHLDAIARMAEANRSCLDILHQLSAVQGALSRVGRELLERHLRECIEAAVADGQAEMFIDQLLAVTVGESAPIVPKQPDSP